MPEHLSVVLYRRGCAKQGTIEQGAIEHHADAGVSWYRWARIAMVIRELNVTRHDRLMAYGRGMSMNSSQRVAGRLLEGGDAVVDKASGLLKAIANDNRLRILCLLEGSELSVTELNQRLSLSQSALSQHLAILRRAELVTTRRASQTIYYSLNGDSASIMIAAIVKMNAANDG